MSLSLVKGTVQDREQAALLLAQCAETLGHGMTPDQLDGYLLALEDVPLEHLQLGLRHAMRTCTWMPKPAEVRRAVDTALAAQVWREKQVDDRDPRVEVHCLTCADTGWAYVRDGVTLAHQEAFGAGLAVKPCPCRGMNPVIARRLAKQSKYATEEQR